MRTTSSLLRAALLSLVLTSAVAPAFAGTVTDNSSQSQQTQNDNTGPYDGAADQAAKHAFY
jgi:hypothetical protein